MKNKRDARLQKSVAYLKKYLPKTPKTACVLGSAWSGFLEHSCVLCRIPYHKIAGFPKPTIDFQKGELLIVETNGELTLVFSGRFHYYEGFEMWECAYPVFVSHLLGVKRFVITNAAGGVNGSLQIGDLVMVCDHVKLCADSPCRGSVNSALGERFFAIQPCYDTALQDLAKDCAKAANFTLKEGTYGYMAGPQYESPAETRMLQILGVDVTGMSTVPEIIACAQCKMPMLCFSLVTNLASNVANSVPSHDEVMDASSYVQTHYAAFLQDVLQRLTQKGEHHGKTTV